MPTETWVHRYIAAKCRLKDPLYMGVNLWPIFMKIMRGFNITPITTTRTFANKHVAQYNAMSEQQAKEFLGLV